MTRRPNKKVTIRTVAELAGVSPMSVSNVLNNTHKVRDSTRQAVMDAVKKLNYSLDPAAKSLAGSGMTRVALMYRNIENAFLSSILIGSLETTNRMGAQLLLQPLDVGDAAEVAEHLQLLLNNGANAILIAPPYCEMANAKGLTRDFPVPVIALSPGDDLADEYCIRIDDFAAARDMTSYLIGLGHRDIGFIRGAEHHLISRTRRDGYIAALTKAGIAIRPELIADGDMSYESGLEAAESLLGLASRPTAIFASNDDMAAAVISLAHRRGFDVPRDLSVAGFDDTPIAVKIWPALTTIRHPGAKIASEAAALAIKLARGGAAPSKVTTHLEYEIAIRESTSAPV
jgi:LacI family transcriptional regulator